MKQVLLEYILYFWAHSKENYCEMSTLVYQGYLNNLSASYDKMNGFVDEGRALDVILHCL